MPARPPAKSKSARTSGKKPLRIKRFRIGFNVLTQIVLLFVIVSVANYLSCQRYRQWDFSSNARFTISGQTESFLENLDQDVRLLVAFRRGGDLTTYVLRMVENYRKSSGGRITVRSFDPELDPGFAAEISNQFDNMRFDENMIIVEPEDGHLRTLREKDIVDRQDNHARGRILRYKLEAALTSALIAATQKEQQKLYFVADKGPLRRTQIGDAFGVLKVYAERQNMLVQPMRLSDYLEIPEDASGVVLINPATDLTKRESEMIKNYWEDKRGGLLVLRNPQAKLKFLDAFLRSYGVVPKDNRIVTTVQVQGKTLKRFAVSAIFLKDPLVPSPALKNLEGRSTEFRGQSSSLHIYTSDPLLKAEGIQPLPLVVAGAQYWGETDYLQDNLVFDAQKDDKQPLYLAASVQKGATGDERLNIDSSRMVVIGNATLLDPDMTTYENQTFVFNAINWMTDREELIGIGPKEAGMFRVHVSDEAMNRMTRISTRILPAGVFLFGLLVVFLRRH